MTDAPKPAPKVDVTETAEHDFTKDDSVTIETDVSKDVEDEANAEIEFREKI